MYPCTDTTVTGPPAAAAGPLGLRCRAFAVGIPLVIAISAISVYADMVTKIVQFGG